MLAQSCCVIVAWWLDWLRRSLGYLGAMMNDSIDTGTLGGMFVPQMSVALSNSSAR
ncbi:hypothetical protein [Burkholderia ubonensis]|uniref:hypothetical protein n=1 Tax=Burkholderia ubonensis TaxID=101571 RepID=UPI000AAA6A2D|nr:hypothetical protein [Burkholderia ubonensis]